MISSLYVILVNINLSIKYVSELIYIKCVSELICIMEQCTFCTLMGIYLVVFQHEKGVIVTDV